MLSLLKETAESSSGYIRWKDLKPGRYEVLKFSLRDSQFGKRVVIDIDGGWIYLPEKMYKKFKTEKSIAKLNKERYDFVFKGQNKFTFEIHDSNAVNDINNEESEDDNDKDDNNDDIESDSNNDEEDDIDIKPRVTKNTKHCDNRKSNDSSKRRAGTSGTNANTKKSKK